MELELFMFLHKLLTYLRTNELRFFPIYINILLIKVLQNLQIYINVCKLFIIYLLFCNNRLFKTKTNKNH